MNNINVIDKVETVAFLHASKHATYEAIAQRAVNYANNSTVRIFLYVEGVQFSVDNKTEDELSFELHETLNLIGD